MRQETVRLFTALEIPESLRSALAAVPGSLKAQMTGARWVPARSMHITLHFIGSVPRESLPEIRRALSGVFPASGAGPFPLSLTAPGFFSAPGQGFPVGRRYPAGRTHCPAPRGGGYPQARVRSEGERRLQAPRDPGTRARGFPGLS